MKITSASFTKRPSLNKKGRCNINFEDSKNDDHVTTSEVVSLVEYIAVEMKKEINAKYILSSGCEIRFTRKIKPRFGVAIDFIMTTDCIQFCVYQGGDKSAEGRADIAKIIYEKF
jgi:hypothetical protein